jgi:CheY-like chemotaxis protein
MWWKKTPKILMVEDDLNNHELFRKSFSDAGFEVMICQTADGDFLGEVVGFRPDIISMDLMIGKDNEMVERDGFSAMRLLKQDERTKNIPIMVLTNFHQDEKIQEAKKLGAVDYINLQGQTITKLPAHFLSYINDSKRFNPFQPKMANE